MDKGKVPARMRGAQNGGNEAGWVFRNKVEGGGIATS
jgi:hypothetical protein